MKRIRLPQHARVQCVERGATLGLTATEICHDAEGDALYMRCIEGQHECRTLRLNEEIALRFRPAETLVGIEDGASPGSGLVFGVQVE
jgi:hypothetical protein